MHAEYLLRTYNPLGYGTQVDIHQCDYEDYYAWAVSGWRYSSCD